MAPKFDALGIVVSDLERAMVFYGLLGLDFPDEPEGHVETTLPGGGRLMLDTEELIRSFDPDWEPPTEAGRIALAFLCDSPAEVDAMFTRLADAGFATKTPPWDAFWGQRYATIYDPDGNVVDLFAPLEA
jgi:uncharacterized glyoxalase superfamily protein PhnB